MLHESWAFDCSGALVPEKQQSRKRRGTRQMKRNLVSILVAGPPGVGRLPRHRYDGVVKIGVLSDMSSLYAGHRRTRVRWYRKNGGRRFCAAKKA